MTGQRVRAVPSARRGGVVLAALFAVTVGLIPATNSKAVAATGYTVSNGPWNVRSCASTVCEVVATMPTGPIPDLACQAMGEFVTLSQSARSGIWDKIRTPSGDVGFVTDLAVNETPLGVYDSRLPHCTGTAGGSVYYQPRYSTTDPVAPSDVTIPLTAWSNGSCAPASDYNIPEVTTARVVTTISGWSLGRLGPTYLLYWNFTRAKQVNSIVLFDPGSYDDYFGSGSCDKSYDQSALYKNWLSLSTNNRLLILAGKVTKDAQTAVGPYAHRGIQEALFPKIRGTAQANQVLVCNYDDLDHYAVPTKFGSVVRNGPQSTCPVAPGVRLYAAWHP